MKRRNEYSLGEAIEAFLESNGIKEKSLVQRVIGEWEKIMGKSVAENTVSLRFDRGTMFIKMGHPVWRNEMDLAKSKIREILNREIGAELVKEVKVL